MESDYLWHHGLQHAKLPCPSLSPRVCSNSHPLSWWCNLTIASSATPFSFCLQSFPASGSFQWVSSLHLVAKVLEFQLQHQSFQWIFRVDFLWLDWFGLFVVQGILKSLLQHHHSKASILQCLAFFMVQLSQLYMAIGKTLSLTIWIFVSKVMSLLFSTLSMFVIAFLPRNRRFLKFCSHSHLLQWFWRSPRK